MNIAIVGGTFDPPHLGHKNIILSSSEIFDKVLVIPNQTPSYKKPNVATDMQRLKMCKIMCKDMKNVEVLDVEVSKMEFNYTINTINELLGSYKGDKISLIIGTDNFLSFQKWYLFEEILNKCELCVFKRENTDLITQKNFLKQKYNAKISIISNDILKISSSELRNNLNPLHLDQNVLGFITENEIYGG